MNFEKFLFSIDILFFNFSLKYKFVNTAMIIFVVKLQRYSRDL
jgi:hypothetical protein